MSFVIGIDPGHTGGIAFLDGTSLSTFETPTYTVEFIKKIKGKSVVRKRSHMDLPAVRDIIKDFNISYALIEQVTAREGQGVTGMFRFGENFGQWQGILVGMGIEFYLVTPQKWKKHFGLLGKEKYDSLELSREFYPSNQPDFKRKKDHGKAEAALIARYGLETHLDVS